MTFSMHDQARRAALAVQAPPSARESPRMRPTARPPARAGAGERKILAGEGRPGEIGAAGQVAGGELHGCRRGAAPRRPNWRRSSAPSSRRCHWRTDIANPRRGRRAPCRRRRKIRKSRACPSRAIRLLAASVDHFAVGRAPPRHLDAAPSFPVNGVMSATSFPFPDLRLRHRRHQCALRLEGRAGRAAGRRRFISRRMNIPGLPRRPKRRRPSLARGRAR